ncbi:MAG: 50S ribosome-binding GTPase [Planctomycetota bacterium]|nr:50S ribosome-binding GTPase [Planctomycetota bacterium]
MTSPATPHRTGPRLALATASAPGAVALLQLTGPGISALLASLTGQSSWPLGRLRLVSFAGIDEGLATLLRDDWAQLMPHGGPRVVQQLVTRLIELGASVDAEQDPRETYPEADSAVEADMLAALARAASSGAIDLLAAQPALWRAVSTLDWPAIERRTIALDRLLVPPTIAVVGRPNVGKSTLTNRLLGRTASLVADLPGTTRDWVAGLVEFDGLAVRWLDTPGLRQSPDPIEQNAITLARGVIVEADVVLAVRDPQLDWPEPEVLPRRPDVWVMNKADLGTTEHASSAGDGSSPTSPLPISGQTGAGLAALQDVLLARLGWTAPARLPALWAFSPFLRGGEAREAASLGKYLDHDRAR